MSYFGEQLRKIRRDRSITQSDLAELIGFSVSTIIRWEAGERTPGVDDLTSIASKLGVPSGYFLGKDEPPCEKQGGSPSVLDVAAALRSADIKSWTAEDRAALKIFLKGGIRAIEELEGVDELTGKGHGKDC